jgi:light-regulated signal transduction histidine kinase (bacteriophytochrome)
MYALLSDLLTYSCLGQEAERVAVDLGAILAEVRRDLSLVISETGAVIDCPALPTIPCDRVKIHSLFQNLIANALKFRGDGPPLVTITATDDGQGLWTFAFADNGIGITPAHREAVFAVFHRLHERTAFPGTGIGLAICRKVVEQHGGRIWIGETPGGGTTVFFTLAGNGSGGEQTTPA